MREIIGENLRKFFKSTKIQGLRTYSGNIGYWPHFEVWEVQERDYERMCNMSDEEFEQLAAKDSWWRGAEGSNMGIPDTDFVINNVSMLAWRNMYKIQDLKVDWDELSGDERSEYANFDDYCDTWMPKKHKDVLTYMCDELGASTGRNICALAVDLAKYNNITMAELFKRYGGSYEDN